MSNHPRNRPQEMQSTINIVYSTVFKMLHRSIHSFKMKLMEGGTVKPLYTCMIDLEMGEGWGELN